MRLSAHVWFWQVSKKTGEFVVRFRWYDPIAQAL
jgi:hypothetical protein